MKFFICFFFLFPSFAQALKIIASTDKKTIAINESLVFTINIYSDKKPENLDIPVLAQLNDFYLLEQWSSQESSISIINFKKERTNTFRQSYRLQPKTTGTLRIESLTVRANKQTFQTKTLFITVIQKNKTPPTHSQPQIPSILPNPFSSPHSVFDIFNSSHPREVKRKKNVKLKLSVNKSSVYKAEMIKADWIILQSSGSVRYEFFKNPSLTGFWKEELKNKKINSFLGTQTIDKILYRKTLLDRYWLFPLKTGELSIDPYSIKVNHIFNFHSQKEIKFSSEKKIRVKALPSQGLDDSFTGAVGSFKVQSLIKENSTVVNRPISYTITFEGLGHPRFIKLPPLNFPSSVQTYPPVEKSNFSDSGKGKKEFEFLIVPKKEGILSIPSFTLSTFDPQAEKYVFHKTSAFSISVEKGNSDEESGQTFFEEEPEKNQKNFSFEPLNKFYWPHFVNQKNLMKFWLLFFSFCLFVLSFLYIKNFIFKKEKSLKKKIKQTFEIIEDHLNKKEWKQACNKMIRVNYSILYSTQTKSTSSDWKQALDKLPPSLNRKYAPQFKMLFKKLEDLSFSPQSHSEKEILDKAHHLFEQTKELIDNFLSEL